MTFRRSFALLIFLIVGCKHASAPRLKAAVPVALAGSAWTAAFDEESGVSIAIPPGWRVGVPRAFDPGTFMNMDATNPNSLGSELQKTASALQTEDVALERKTLARLREREGIVLHCVDGSKPVVAEEPTRIYVKKVTGADYGTLEAAATAEKQDTHREAKVESVDLPVGKAVRLIAQGQDRIGDIECHVSYVLLDGPDAYVLRFASTNNPDATLTIDRQAAQTFRLAKAR